MFRKRSFAVGVLLILTGGLSLAACSSSEDTTNPPSPIPSVDVLVSEWIVQPKPNQVKAGQVKIFVDNAGSDEHELVVYRGNKADLPLKANGSVDEDAAEANIVGEIGEIKPGETKSKIFDLKPAGEYTIFCNVVHEPGMGMDHGSDTELVRHYQKGMVSSLTVTANN
ncbi:MAG: hypothetical protein WCH93_04965 [Actinomycetota bacterium]